MTMREVTETRCISGVLSLHLLELGEALKEDAVPGLRGCPSGQPGRRAGASMLCGGNWHFSLTAYFLSRQFGQLPCLALGDDSILNLYDTLQLLRLPDKHHSLHQSVTMRTSGRRDALKCTWTFLVTLTHFREDLISK